MAEGEEDFSSLPLPERFTHKVRLAPGDSQFTEQPRTNRRMTDFETWPTELESAQGGL